MNVSSMITDLNPDLSRARAGESTPTLLGQRLIELGKLTPVQLEYALQKQQVEGGRLGKLLIAHGLLTERDLAISLSQQRSIAFLDVELAPTPDPQLMALFNRELCLTRGFIPLRRGEAGIEVLLGSGEPDDVADLVQKRCGTHADFRQGEFTAVAQMVRREFYFAQHPVQALVAREVALLADDADRTRGPEKLLDHILTLAVRERATDIHIDPSASSFHVLFRIDGVLRPRFAMPPALSRLLVFIKLSAEMDISEQRRPQDGSFHTTVFEVPFTVRVSSLVADSGERLVLRLLPERNDLARLDQLGFRQQDIVLLQKVFAKPSGMVLLTGPTGSGKSTTLHAALRLQALIERNILTVEDPIEYRLSTICQTQVNRRAGYDFSTALRHFLRHDPDVMLVGEIRDAETAQAAVTASATGHLVLSTLHVSSVFGVVPRLLPLGLEPQTIAENLVAVINQRLVRRNCPFCSRQIVPTPAQERWLSPHPVSMVAAGCGCERCGHTGFLGRLPVYEILVADEAMCNAISAGAPRASLRDIAHAAGFAPIAELAKWRIAQGQTTFDEVARVIGEGPLP